MAAADRVSMSLDDIIKMNRSRRSNSPGIMRGNKLNLRGGRKGGRGGYTQQSFRGRAPSRNRILPISRVRVQTPSRNNNGLIQRRNLFQNGQYAGAWQQQRGQFIQRQGMRFDSRAIIQRQGMRFDSRAIQSRLNTMHRQMMLARNRVRRAQQLLNTRSQNARYPQNLRRGFQRMGPRVGPVVQRARSWPTALRNPMFGVLRSDSVQLIRNNGVQPRLMGQGGPNNMLTVSITNERAEKRGRRNSIPLRGGRMGRANVGRAMIQQRRPSPNVGYLNRQSIARLNATNGCGGITVSPNGSVITTISQKSNVATRRSRSVSRRRQQQRSQSVTSERRPDFLNLDLQKEIAAIQRKTFSIADIVYPEVIESQVVDGVRFRPTATSTRVTLNERFSQ